MFLQKMLTSAKLRESWYLYIFWNYICVCTYLPNFKFSRIILTSFRQGVVSPPPHTHTRTPQNNPPKKPTQIRGKYGRYYRCKDFKIKNLLEHHDLYLKSITLLLVFWLIFLKTSGKCVYTFIL